MIMNDVYFKRDQDLLRLGVSVLEHRKKMIEAMGKYESSHVKSFALLVLFREYASALHSAFGQVCRGGFRRSSCGRCFQIRSQQTERGCC
jgi:hypothetical protein